MPFAITQSCCSDASCIAVCPVNCIHPTPEEREFGSTEMLHIDPESCIDCGACADACPVDAIHPVEILKGPEKVYAELNASYYEGRRETTPTSPRPNFHQWGKPTFDRTLPSDFTGLDVAVVGSGPAGMYAVEDLILHTSSTITVIDRLNTAGGLIKFGVAPDHPATRKVGEKFSRMLSHPRVRTRLGVEVGRDVTHEELLGRYDAVIYAVGAPGDKPLAVTGGELSSPATQFVGWYNGHPDIPGDAYALTSERVVIVGMGNVALDVARILTADPDTLADTAIAPHALEWLRKSAVREVVLLARGTAEKAAFTNTEMLGLLSTPGVKVVVDDQTGLGAGPGALEGVEHRAIDWSKPPKGRGNVILRFGAAPAEVTADGVRTTDGTTIEAGLVLHAIGSRGIPTPGVPFDETTGTVPNEQGRVTGQPRTYVVGWAKRGPSGGIGENRRCAHETVSTLLSDAVAGLVKRPRKRSLLLLAR